jgi:hypothetical protein
MLSRNAYRRAFSWLTILLVVVSISLVFQLFPSLWPKLHWLLDMRNWTRTDWLIANTIMVLILFYIRFSTRLYPGIMLKFTKLVASSVERSHNQSN